MFKYLLASALVVVSVPSLATAEVTRDDDSIATQNQSIHSNDNSSDVESLNALHGGGGGGGGFHGGGGGGGFHGGGGGGGFHGGGGHPGNGGGSHGGNGGHPVGGGGHPGNGGGNHGGSGGHPGNGGGHGTHGTGHIGNPVHIGLGHEPGGGWRGNHYYWGGHAYFVWAWGPWAPWWGWGPYFGWRLGLGYYIPEGLKCYADNPDVAGEWAGETIYYSSDDAINSALGLCENDPHVVGANASGACRIRTCVRW